VGKTISIAFLVIFAAVSAWGQEQAARVANSDSSANVSTTYKPSPAEQPSVTEPAGDLTFAVKIVPGTSKKFNVEVVSPKSGYAEVSLLNSRGDQMLILHKGKIKSGPITFGIDAGKIKPGLYYVVSKYEGGLQVADKFTVAK
jgi:hypothetical protein